MSDGMTDAAREAQALADYAEQHPSRVGVACDTADADPAKWEEQSRAALASNDARAFVVPRAYLERALQDVEKFRDIARLVGE